MWMGGLIFVAPLIGSGSTVRFFQRREAAYQLTTS
jgi:hypothetical protein